VNAWRLIPTPAARCAPLETTPLPVQNIPSKAHYVQDQAAQREVPVGGWRKAQLAQGYGARQAGW